MKAVIPRAIVGFVIAIVFVLIVATTIVTLPDVFAKGAAEELLKFKPIKSYSFDINDFLVDSADSKAFDSNKQNVFFGIGTADSDPAFCKNLRNCIDMNIKGGKQCLISYKVKPGTNFNPNIIWDSIRNRCPFTDIKEELYSKTGRKVCKFNPNSLQPNNSLREDNISLMDYEPEIHNCFIPDNLGGLNVLNDVNSFNYLYSGRGSVNGYSFENGGTVRIVVTNVSINADPYATCSYSLYVCGQNAIANTTVETPVKIFRIIQNLNEKELYYNKTIVWGGQPKEESLDIFWWVLCRLALGGDPFGWCGPPPQLPLGYNVYGYYPHPYEFIINGECKSRGTCDKALIDAIDAGMWEWNKANYDNKKKAKYFLSESASKPLVYFSYRPIINISQNPSIDFDSNCWNVGFENSDVQERIQMYDSFYNLPEENFMNSNVFLHIFNFDNFNIANKVKMTIGIKKIFITDKVYKFSGSDWTTLTLVKTKYNLEDDFESRVILVLDPITFCSSGASVPCIPTTCTALGYNCGSWPDGCSGTLDCGACPVGQECNVGVCVPIVPSCGDGVLDAGEECDPPQDSACSGSCIISTCKCPWPSPHDKLTENVGVETIRYGSLIVSLYTTKNIDNTGVDIIWYDISDILESGIESKDTSIKKEGTQSMNSSKDYVAFTFANILSTGDASLASIDLNNFKNVYFSIRFQSLYGFSTSFDNYLQFIDINGKKATYFVSQVPPDAWYSYGVSLSDPLWQIEADFDKTKVTYVRVGEIIGSTHRGLAGDVSWLDDFYFTN